MAIYNVKPEYKNVAVTISTATSFNGKKSFSLEFATEEELEHIFETQKGNEKFIEKVEETKKSTSKSKYKTFD